jgi:hypothetical protein
MFYQGLEPAVGRHLVIKDWAHIWGSEGAQERAGPDTRLLARLTEPAAYGAETA